MLMVALRLSSISQRLGGVFFLQLNYTTASINVQLRISATGEPATDEPAVAHPELTPPLLTGADHQGIASTYL